MSDDGHMCKRCLADIRPENFGSDRNCAFNADGSFSPKNWNCATIERMYELELNDDDYLPEHTGDDESMQVLTYRWTTHDGYKTTEGFIVFNRYKHHGCTESAAWVGNFWPPRPLSLGLAEAVIAGERAEEI